MCKAIKEHWRTVASEVQRSGVRARSAKSRKPFSHIADLICRRTVGDKKSLSGDQRALPSIPSRLPLWSCSYGRFPVSLDKLLEFAGGVVFGA